MTVTDIYTNGSFYKPEQLTEGFLTDNFCINSTAHIEYVDNTQKFIGSATESAILVAYLKSVSDESAYIKNRENADIDFTFSFSSETKKMTTVLHNGNSFLALSKGSPEMILAQCSKIIIKDCVCDLTNESIVDIEEKITVFQKKACRVLAFAHKEFSEKLDYESNRTLMTVLW
jgi:Ca2+-transporting ATPase